VHRPAPVIADEEDGAAALARDPKLAEAHYFRGIVHQRWSEADAAIADYLAATEADATSAASAPQAAGSEK